ncbi:MAG: peptide ABC transporter ATP-binding protein, partial [Oscillospiraceae bacterium]|nr:peptide ABC transporter ATP-binding protein [Oscillospiraceae bacterium]
VYGNKKEIEEYKAIRERNVKVKSINIKDPDAPEAPEAKPEEDPIPAGESILDTPLHDTGSKWYAVLSFFLPLLGLIAGLIFRKFNHIRNYKACKKGAIAGLITIGTIILFFCLMLLLSVI